MGSQDITITPQIQEPLTLQKLNDQLRKIWTQINGLLGKTDAPEVHESLTVTGTLTAAHVKTNGMQIGPISIFPANPTLSPTTDSALMGEALTAGTTLGGRYDLLTPVNPFTTSVKDEFMGASDLSGEIGELGWEINGTGAVGGAAELGHPGVFVLTNPPGPDVGYMRLNTFSPQDVNYLAAIIRPGSDRTNQNIAFGYATSNPLAGVEVTQGAYFSYVAATSSNWRTVTRNGIVSTVTQSTIPVVNSSWFLLEMVVNVTTSSQIIDFYINRSRIARHTTNISASTTTARPTIFNQATTAAFKEVHADLFIMQGRLPLSTKRWS